MTPNDPTHTFTLTEQEAVARAWVDCAGLPELELAVHPRDEMQGFLAANSPRQDAHRFEYLRSGEEAFRVVSHSVAACGRSLAGTGRLLDFACGYGRVTRFFVHALGASRVAVAEIDAEAVAFVRRTFATDGFLSVTDPKMLHLPGTFDVVFVGSLFSHLPRVRFAQWLARLAACLGDGGLLVFTTHGAHLRPDAERESSGFFFVPSSETVRLDPREYGSTFVRPEVVCELAAAAGLNVLGYAERELWDLQEVFVVQRGGGDPARRLPTTAITYGRIERACLPRPGHAWIGGGTRIPAREAPLREVRLVVDGNDLGAAMLGAPVRHAPANREPFVTTEWYTEGDASFLLPGLHTVCAVGITASGRREAFGARGLRV